MSKHKNEFKYFRVPTGLGRVIAPPMYPPLREPELTYWRRFASVWDAFLFTGDWRDCAVGQTV